MTASPRLAVIWIDWYAYHIARFRALAEHTTFTERACGIELVGGNGVHAGFQFRDDTRHQLSITTLLPDADWATASQWRLALLLWKRLNAFAPTFVLVPGYYTLPALAAALWGRLHGARTVLMSESTEVDHARARAREWIKGALVRSLFDYAVVGGTRHLHYLRRLGFDESRIGLRYNVVDNAFFREGVGALRRAGRGDHLDAQTSYFLFVGRLSPEKNVEMLLRSFAEYRRQGGDWRLVLVGDGPSRASLMSLVSTLGVIEHVTFAGHRSTQDLLPYYAFSSAFVLPSLREPWGLVVNEAMASGLPVIVSNRCGAAGDLVAEGENGFTFDPSSQAELTDRLLRLSGSSDDTRLAMAQRSQEMIEEFSPRRWASEVARIAAA